MIIREQHDYSECCICKFHFAKKNVFLNSEGLMIFYKSKVYQNFCQSKNRLNNKEAKKKISRFFRQYYDLFKLLNFSIFCSEIKF